MLIDKRERWIIMTSHPTNKQTNPKRQRTEVPQYVRLSETLSSFIGAEDVLQEHELQKAQLHDFLSKHADGYDGSDSLEALIACLKSRGDITYVNVVKVTVLVNGGEDVGIAVEQHTTIQALKPKISKLEGTPIFNMQLFLVDSSEDERDGKTQEGVAVPLDEDYCITQSCTLALHKLSLLFFERCGSNITISGNDGPFTATMERMTSRFEEDHPDYNCNTDYHCAVLNMAVGQNEEAYFELRMDVDMGWHDQFRKRTLCRVGAVRHDRSLEQRALKISDDMWFLDLTNCCLNGNGADCGRGRPGDGTHSQFAVPGPPPGGYEWPVGFSRPPADSSHLNPDASFRAGDTLGVLIDTAGKGRVVFFKNREQFGPGFRGAAAAPPGKPKRTVSGHGDLLLCVEMGTRGCQCTLIPGAVKPAEPFVRWAGYREDQAQEF